MKKLKQMFLAILTCMMVLAVFPAVCEAAEIATVPKVIKKVCIPGKMETGSVEVPIENIPYGSKVKISDLKYSKSLLTLKDRLYLNGHPFDSEDGGISFAVKKPGTAKVSFKVKANGKCYQRSTTIKLISYENPFRSFKIGTRNYTSKFSKIDKKWGKVANTIRKNIPKGKLQIKMKPDWKLVKMYKSRAGAALAKEIKVRNNRNVTLEKKYSLTVIAKNKKTGAYEQFLIDPKEGYVRFLSGYFK